MKQKPNIVFFFTDDQRFDTIAALGHPDIQTPHLDEMVRRGTTFTHAHIPGGTVGAVCMPSRAMLHTGRTLFHLTNNGGRISEEHLMLGELLQMEGYRTFGTGKWHNGTRAYARSFTDGAEIMFGGMGDHWNVNACHFDPSGAYPANKVIADPFKNNLVETRMADHIVCGKHSSELFCDAAIDWLHNYKGEDPYFMYIAFMAPHDPRSMPEPFHSMYNPEEIKLPDNVAAEHPFDFGVSGIRDEVLAPYPRTEEIVRQHIADYYGMITHLDHEIGRVIQVLKDSGQYDNTIIVFAADNGLAVGQHGLFGKQSNYEHSVRVPLIFAGPGIPEGEQRSDYVYLLDIFPTLCDLIGAGIPGSVEGMSLAPLIRSGQTAHVENPTRESLYLAYGDLVRSVKNRRYKLIEYRSDHVKRTQLFDLIDDPCEQHDLFGQPDYDDTVHALRQELFRYKKEWEDDKHPVGAAYWGRY